MYFYELKKHLAVDMQYRPCKYDHDKNFYEARILKKLKIFLIMFLFVLFFQFLMIVTSVYMNILFNALI